MADWDVTSVQTSTSTSHTGHSGLLQMSSDKIVMYARETTPLIVRILSVDGSYNVTENTSTQVVANGLHASAVAVDDDTFLISYQEGVSLDGFVRLCTVNADNTISLGASLEFDTANGSFTSICKLSQYVYAVAYSGTSSDGFVKTLSLATDYSGISVVDTLEFNITLGIQEFILALSETNFMIGYRDTNSDGVLATFSCTSAGASITLIDSLVHDTGYGSSPFITRVDDTHVFVGYSGNTTASGQAASAYVNVFSFDSGYDNLTEVYSLQHDTNQWSYDHATLKLDDTHYAVVSRLQPTDDVHAALKIFELDESYNITQIKSERVGTMPSLGDVRAIGFVFIDVNHVMVTIPNTRITVYSISFPSSGMDKFFMFF